MMSRLQTIDIYLPNVEMPLHGLEWIPVCPLPLDETDKTKPRRIVKEDGTKITWVENEHVRVELPDGTQKYFPCKPTMKEAIILPHGPRSFYKFNKDGSVEYSDFTWGNYYWGPDTERPAEVGEKIEPHKCLDGMWDFYDTCHRSYYDNCDRYSDPDKYNCRCGNVFCSDCFDR
jgi:hypothetical protein